MRIKGLAAVLTAGTMVICTAMPAMADDAVTGTGQSTGHVNKAVVNITLPTVAEAGDTFNFIMDAERLIRAAGSKLNETAVTLPAAAGDKGVYFLQEGGSYTYTEVEDVTYAAEGDDVSTYFINNPDYDEDDPESEEIIAATGKAQSGVTYYENSNYICIIKV